MIKLYHGSTIPVEQPMINVGRKNLDFGQGFYLTRLQEQAQAWAIRMQLTRQASQAWLNIYEFDLEAALSDGYRHLCLEAYDRQWLDFISASRHGEEPWKEYDLIEGGVANDKVVDAIEAYLSGLADLEHTLGKLAYAKPNHQICLRSQALIDHHLHYVDSQQITEQEEGGIL